MDTTPLTTTSWSHSSCEIDVRAYRRYNHVLSWSAFIGEITVFILIIGFMVGCLMLLNTNFETVIFYDGTDAPCLFTGHSGEISHAK